MPEAVQAGSETSVLVASSDSEYARRRRQHMSLINQLRSIGAQADLDLPRIAVIGNQSAGKSSLVEAISGISVPRDAGTCTRCPMECRLMLSSEPWSCQVSIRWEFGPNGKRKDKVYEEAFGALIHNKKDVELALRRAQAAVLNPSKDQGKFLKRSAADLKEMNNELKFSRNAVCVQLSGPELTDLAFVDLPGIIQNAEADIVQLVEDLVTSNIKGNCLILVTLPMSDDIENQKAAQLAKIADPSGLRTIGVMTKPDTLPPGATKSRRLWLDVLEGRRHVTTLGYYCTRQPDDEERSKGISTAQARIAEKDFFAKTSPWGTSTHKDRFGTDNLVSNLSKLLAKIIDDSLPKLQKEVMSQLDYCNRELKDIPPAVTSDPASYVLTLVTEFCSDVMKHIRGGEAHAAELVQANRRIYAAFQRDIRDSAPPFVPCPSPDEAGSDLTQCLDMDDEDADADMDDDPAPVAARRLLYLEDVRKHIELSLARELPHNVPYSAKISLIENFQASWEADTQRCFRSIYRTFEAALTALVKERFKRYEHLANYILQAVRELLREKETATLASVKTTLALEKNPYTQNRHYLQVTKDKYLSVYKEARAQAEGQPPAKKQKRNGAVKGDAPIFGIPSTLGAPRDASKATSAFAGFGGSASSSSTQTAFSTGLASFSSSQGPKNPPSLSAFTFPAPPTNGANDSAGTKPSSPKSPAPAKTVPLRSSSPASSSTPTLAAASAAASTAQKRGLDDDERELHERTALAALAMLGYSGITANDFAKLHEQDIYESEMEVMAEVRAYFQVAYKRIIDAVPMAIDGLFLFAFADAAQGFLIERLGLGTQKAAARCATFLAEDPMVVIRREELTRKKARLEQVQLELEMFDL